MITIYILHAGITHPSPYFYNFCKKIDKYDDFNYVINPDIPKEGPNGNGIIYFNRLKRFYDSNDKESAFKFIELIKSKKEQGWKIVMTLHNFFPIDRDITDVDEYVTKEFLNLCDLVFTLSEYMKKSIKKYYEINAINHGMGFNVLDGDFDNNIVKNNKYDKYVFTFVGNIYKYKMLDKVIEDFNKIDNAYLIIAGRESKNASVFIKDLIKDNKNIIFYDGFIGNNDWKKISNITNCFINIYDINYPAFKYGFFPSNFINIYNTGICCISPKHDIVTEMMKDEQMIYYDFKDTNGLLNAMKKAIKLNKKPIINDTNKKYNWDRLIEIFTINCKELFNENRV